MCCLPLGKNIVILIHIANHSIFRGDRCKIWNKRTILLFTAAFYKIVIQHAMVASNLVLFYSLFYHFNMYLILLYLSAWGLQNVL